MVKCLSDGRKITVKPSSFEFPGGEKGVFLFMIQIELPGIH